MKNNFLHKIKNLSFDRKDFSTVAWFTFIVYFIAVFCGWFNFFFAAISGKNYFPLRSYLVVFSDDEISNILKITKGAVNLAGYKAKIFTTIPYKLIDDVFFIFICSLIIILFICGYLIAKSGEISQTQIIKWSVIFSILAASGIPSHSSDLYGYIARGAQQSLYHQNPYLETVSEINNHKLNPLFLNFMWTKQHTTYGPFFISITKAIVLLSHNNFFLSFINFKLMNLTLFFILLFFVLKITDEKNIYLIAWNPLLIIQGLWNCHNDLFSGTLIFCGIYMFLRKDYFWSVFLFIVSAAVKYVSLIILPFILFKIIKNNFKFRVLTNIILGITSGVLLVLIFSTDYLISASKLSPEDFQTIFSNINLVHKSFISTIFSLIKFSSNLLNLKFDHAFILSILKILFYISFILFYIFILTKADDVTYNIALILFVFFCFVIAKFHSWYLLNFIVLLPFLKESKLKKILITLSLSHVYALTFIDQAKILNFTFMTLLPILYIYFKAGKKV